MLRLPQKALDVATLAKQVVTQRIKEAERDLLYKEYVKKEFQIITGTVLRNDKDHVFY